MTLALVEDRAYVAACAGTPEGDMPDAMVDVVYKICPRESWLAATRTGALPRSAVDARDGFVHLSSAAQVRGTAERHFAGQRDLVLLAVVPERLAPGALRWEPSRGGELFPHLYDELRPEHVARVDPLGVDARGAFVFPPLE